MGLAWGGAMLAGFNVAVVMPSLRDAGGDFTLWYAVGSIVRTHGTARIYDLDLQRQVARALVGRAYENPFVSPPLMAWLAVPFTFLPRQPAYALWVAGLAGALVVACLIAAPGSRWWSLSWLALGLGLFPVAFGILIGAVSTLGVIGVVVAWRLLRAGRPLAGGLVLSLLILKPQLVFLVPFTLLVAGHGRFFLGWIGGTAALLAVSWAALGTDGMRAMFGALQFASTWTLTERFTLGSLLGEPWLRLAEAGVAVAGLVAAWRVRGRGVEIPIAAGILASLLATPHLSVQDLAMLLPAAWLTWRAHVPLWLRAVVVAGWIPVELALAWGPLPILIFELAWLGCLAVVPRLLTAPQPARVELVIPAGYAAGP